MGPGERARARLAGARGLARRLGRGLASGAGLGAALALACATTPVVATGEGWRHRELGYTIAAPPSAPGPWRRVRVKGADLAFRGPDGETMSLLSRCTDTTARPRVQARNLTIGLGRRERLAAGPISLNGAEGWAQSFRLEQGGVPLRLHTVTLVSGGCTFDFVLSARVPDASGAGADPAALEESLASFDAWWRSFRFTAGTPAAPPPEGGG